MFGKRTHSRTASRRAIVIVLIIALSVLSLVTLTACNKENGTYYKVTKDGLNYNSWIELKQGNWTDNDELEGTYTVEGEILSIYYIEPEIPFLQGIIKDGVIVIEGISVYAQEDVDYDSILNSILNDDADDGNADGSGDSDTDSDDSGNSGGGDSSTTPATKYTVTFDTDGGSSISSISVDKDAKIAAPSNPTKDKYSFGGWYSDSQFKQLWDFTVDKVTSNITLYAKWNLEEAKIVAFENAAIDGLDILLVVEDTTDYVNLASAVTISGGGSWKLYYDMLGQTEIPTKIVATTNGRLQNGYNPFYIVTTTADGSQTRTYELSVHRKYETTVSIYDSYDYNTFDTFLGSEVCMTYESLPSFSQYAPTGYEITGYYLADGTEFDVEEKTVDRATSLYISKSPKKYTVTLDANGGALAEDVEDTKEVTYNSSYSLPVPTREGYTFLGWSYYQSQDYYNDLYTDADGISINSWRTASNTTLYARWQINYYQVDTLKNLEEAGSVTGNGSHAYHSSYTLSATTNAGYTFIGWYDEDDNKVSEDASLSYTVEEQPARDMQYTAKWMECPVTIATDLGGTVTQGLPSATIVGEEYTVTASPDGSADFLGWYDGDTKVSTDDELSYTFTMSTEEKTYTAKWIQYILTVEANDDTYGSVAIGLGERNPVVSFDLNGASGTAPTAQTLSDTVGLVYPTVPTRSGYVFTGWYTTPACTTLFDFTADVIYSTTVYAGWYQSSQYIDYNSSKSIGVVSKSNNSSTYNYAFVPLASGTVTIYSTGSMDTYGYLYSSNNSQLESSDDDGDGNNFRITYNVTAGRVYYVRPYGFSSSGTTTVHISGPVPTAGGKSSANSELTKGYPAGYEVTISATGNAGYTFLGWYDGDTLVSSDLVYTFEMPAVNITYTAKWEPEVAAE